MRVKFSFTKQELRWLRADIRPGLWSCLRPDGTLNMDVTKGDELWSSTRPNTLGRQAVERGYARANPDEAEGHACDVCGLPNERAGMCHRCTTEDEQNRLVAW